MDPETVEALALLIPYALMFGAFGLWLYRRPKRLLKDGGFRELPVEWHRERGRWRVDYHLDPRRPFAALTLAAPLGPAVTLGPGPNPRPLTRDALFEWAVDARGDRPVELLARLDETARRAVCAAIDAGARYAEGRWTLFRDDPIDPPERAQLADLLLDAADALDLGSRAVGAVLFERLRAAESPTDAELYLRALIDSADPEATAACEWALTAPDPALRVIAARHLDAPRARPSLRAVAADPAAPIEHRVDALRLLAAADRHTPAVDRAALRALVDELIRHVDPTLALAALTVADPLAHAPVDRLLPLLDSGGAPQRAAAARLLRHATDEATLIDALAAAVTDHARAALAPALARVGGITALRALAAIRLGPDATAPQRAAVRDARAALRARVDAPAGALALADPGDRGALSLTPDAGRLGLAEPPRGPDGAD